MVKAFVFGKFIPFHKGHEALIHFALSQCDHLSVLVCCSNKETIPGHVRKQWMEETFAGADNIGISVFNYDEDDLPNTSETSATVSKAWAGKFKELFPGYALVITSEPYGELVAGFIGIKHIAFDEARKIVSISASAIRNDIVTNWYFLPLAVKPYFAIKVVILGTESTGKSTLTENLAKHYACSMVTEAGRDLIPDSNEFVFDDLYKVAAEHARRIEAAARGDSAMVIIDTDIHITKSYARFAFEAEQVVSDDIYNVNRATLYLYLNNDVDFSQDGTRLYEEQRNLLDASHRQILKEHNINIVEIKGDWQERFEQAVKAIGAMLNALKYRING